MYKRVNAQSAVRRPFAIMAGLREGYGPSATTHQIEEVIQVSLDWMKGRAAIGQPFVTGMISSGEVVYAWPEGSGKAGGGHEHSATFNGEVSPLYNAHLTDEEVVELLNELAAELGRQLGQTRVYVAYRDEIWVLQAEQTVTPRGESV